MQPAQAQFAPAASATISLRGFLATQADPMALIEQMARALSAARDPAPASMRASSAGAFGTFGAFPAAGTGTGSGSAPTRPPFVSAIRYFGRPILPQRVRDLLRGGCAPC